MKQPFQKFWVAVFYYARPCDFLIKLHLHCSALLQVVAELNKLKLALMLKTQVFEKEIFISQLKTAFASVLFLFSI